MTIILNDPTWWPAINSYRVFSYFLVASFVIVTYDWALTFGQETELVWKQRWSLMTALYLSVRYFGIISTALYMLVGAVMSTIHASWEEIILSGTYLCSINFGGDTILLGSITWILGTAWEVLALCLAVWIAVKHFREMRPYSAGGFTGMIGDCYTVLMKTHMLYFSSFLAVSCFRLIIDLSPVLSGEYSLSGAIGAGLFQIFEVAQTFVLGPRLILSIREYHANLVADSDAATRMTSIAFEERVHISTGSSV
ncbi:hypothetical protein BDR03DRAFT_1008703 [Suillus americanus]|nr:hypothetical protein BDR03DRAFT_1008703 [Suillus americanus]